MTKRSLVDLYKLKEAELEELKENLGVQLWLEWLKTPTATPFSEPEYPNEAEKQLEDLRHNTQISWHDLPLLTLG